MSSTACDGAIRSCLVFSERKRWKHVGKFGDLGGGFKHFFKNFHPETWGNDPSC